MSTIEKIQKDTLAFSVAQALAVANEAALAQGVDPANSLVTISEENGTSDRLWRIHYGPPQKR